MQDVHIMDIDVNMVIDVYVNEQIHGCQGPQCCSCNASYACWPWYFGIIALAKPMNFNESPINEFDTTLKLWNRHIKSNLSSITNRSSNLITYGLVNVGCNENTSSHTKFLP